MTYYSGTSKKNYDLDSQLNTLFPSRKPSKIHCFEKFIQARGFAYKRAEQDASVGVVIEIIREEDFEMSSHSGYPILIGKLTHKNSKIHLLEDIDFTE